MAAAGCADRECFIDPGTYQIRITRISGDCGEVASYDALVTSNRLADANLLDTNRCEVESVESDDGCRVDYQASCVLDDGTVVRDVGTSEWLRRTEVVTNSELRSFGPDGALQCSGRYEALATRR